MFYWSELDEKRFGLKTAKLFIDSSSINISEELNDFKKNNGKLFIARCDATLSETLFQMQAQGFFLTDSMLTFSTTPSLNWEGINKNFDAEVVLAAGNDSEYLAEISGKAFAGYRGHYHNNPALAKNLCDEVYIDWARNLVLNNKMADVVFICRVKGQLAGFASLKVNEKGVAVAGLLGVLPEFRDKGVGKLLNQVRFKWCLKKGIEEINVETSLSNSKYINVLLKLGFNFSKGIQVLHLNNFHRL